MKLSYLKENGNSFRYERKFVISEIDRHEVEAIIKCHPALFVEIFQERSVNSIYFDSLNMDSHNDNKGGTSERSKRRIRWYGPLFGLIDKAALELKIKDNQVGTKMVFPLLPFRLHSGFSLKYVMDVFKRSDIPEFVREELMLMQVVLLIRYRRKYFQSVDRKYRLTIDWDMEYYIMDDAFNTFAKKRHDFLNTVLELKYSEDNDDKARFITKYFPFRISRNSKYVVGIDGLFYFR